MTTSRPTNHLNAASHMYPNAWKLVDVYRAGRGVDLPEWPAWCFLPMAAWYAIVSDDAGTELLPPHIVPDIARLAAIGTWRYTQGVYSFDPDLDAALTSTTLRGELPIEVLLRLPEWSVYIDTPNSTWLGEPLHGYWAHLEWDARTGRHELRLLLDTNDMLLPQILHLGRWTVTEAMDRWVSESNRQAQLHKLTGLPGDTSTAVEAMANAMQPLLARLLYLCSDEPEIDDRAHPGEQPRRPKPKRTKRGWRLFAAKKTRTWSVGERTGELIRHARDDAEATDRRVTPHIRRAHWHGYWTGPKTGERRFSYKWLPPTVVGSDK